MARLVKFDEFIYEELVAFGFGPSNTSKFSLGSQNAVTGYSMTPIVGKVTGLGNQIAEEANSYERNDNPKHKAKEYLKEAKKFIDDKINECFESIDKKNESLVLEEEAYEFVPQETLDRLKKREEMNLTRFRAAQDRGDNYAIKYYELRITLDKIDKKKLEVQTEIYKLNKKFKKD